MTDRITNGRDEIAEQNGEDSPGKVTGLLPGMEDALGGHTLGQYQLMERLGRGGMATIYKAYQPSLDRYVAVKVLSTFLAQKPDFAARFQREARAIAKLNHPNILPVYDYGQQGELAYIVMRYVEEGTLQDMLDKLGQPLDLDMAVEISSQVGAALDYAHQRGIVHRDVKPSNVLMADGSWALLSDFGLAKMIGASKRITKAGVGMGTPTYTAPEQARGRGVDGRSDIYSLGIILFEMLTGQVPFDGDSSLATVYKHLTDPPPPPREINPDIPEPVERVVLKALAKNPVDRFQRAGEMVTALQQAAAGEPTITRAISLAEEGERRREKLAAVYGETVPIRRRVPVWVWGAIGGAILLAAAIAGATLRASPTSTPAPAMSTPTVDVANVAAAVVTLQAEATATAAAFTPTPTPTQTPAPPTPTDTPAPTDTPTPAQTPVPPTASPTPGARKTPTAIATAVETPTNTSTGALTAKTPRPTHTPAPPAQSYPAPVLIKPEDGANPGASKPTFSWRWDGQLQDNEYFDLRMWAEGSADHRIGVMDYRETPRQPTNGEYVVVDVSIDKVGNEDRTNGTYYWSVAVMREVDGKMVDVSSEATPHKLIYAVGEGREEKPLPP